MAGINKVILVGNLGKDPEIRHLESGASVANFSLATTETYKDRTTGERKSITEWHNIVLWRGLAEVAEKYLKKGNQVYIEGKITTRSYEDKDGIKKYITEVVGRDLTMLGGRSDNDGGSYSNSGSNNNNNYEPTNSDVDATEEETDDLPF